MRDQQPKGFSKDAQKRIEQQMIKRAQKLANQIPQLPPELAQQIAGGIGLAVQGKFSNIQVGLGEANSPTHVRILIFKDEMGMPHVQKQPLLAVPGSAAPPESIVNKNAAEDGEVKQEIEETDANPRVD